MRGGKRFATPTGGESSLRQRGYAPARGTYPAAASTPTSRWRSPGGGVRYSRGSREEAPFVQARPQPRSSGRQMVPVAASPERRSQVVLGNSTQSSMPSTSVHHMLSELVDLSHSIAALLEQESLSPTPARSSSARQQEAGLKTQEIERIVRRVEAHFVDKIQTLEATNATLKDEVQHLREALQASQAIQSSGAANPEVRGGLREEIEALDALDRAWSNEVNVRNGTAPLSEAEQLRRVLLAEKRQRLRVEEQTQSLTEQHAKVVGTLERRLKKQEEQLYDLIAAIDRGYSGYSGVGGPSGAVVTSPTRSTEPGSSHRLSTPRHLLRQQLAQHQQTQRALQEYKQNLRFEPSSPMTEKEVAAMEELGLDDVRRTLESIRSSKPATVQDEGRLRSGPVVAGVSSSVSRDRDEPEILYTSVASAASPPSQLGSLSAAAAATGNEVDEIANFLDNITKELESLGTE